jgi:hypothetical protein
MRLASGQQRHVWVQLAATSWLVKTFGKGGGHQNTMAVLVNCVHRINGAAGVLGYVL